LNNPSRLSALDRSLPNTG